MSFSNIELHGFDQDMVAIEIGVCDYVLYGDKFELSFPLEGLEVFAVIAGLRKCDTIFYVDSSGVMGEEQKERLERLEKEVDDAVEANLQYFPFGHDTNRRVLSETEIKRLKSTNSSWGVAAHRQSKSFGSGSSRGSEFVTGSYSPKIR